jgi:phage/plasmid-like protein (TIGR03299 family)
MSASILDQVIANTGNSSPTVVSEEHDVTNINFVAGLSDPGEMIACGYLPQLRRQAGEADKEYAARIYPLVMALPAKERDVIMQAAIRRAGLDASTGKVAVMVAGEPAWHGLGVNIAEATDSANAIVLASLNWEVLKRPLSYVAPGGRTRNADGTFAMVRSDTGAFLGVAGSQYTPIQNSAGFAFLDAVLADFGARYETAGSVYGGQKVWMQVHLPRQSFTVGSTRDSVDAYALFTNPHVPGEKAGCFPTGRRAVCANTMRVAIGHDRHRGIRIAHRGNIKAKIKKAQAALGIAVQGFAEYKEVANVLSVTKAEVVEYANGVLDQVLKVTQAQAVLGAEQLTSDKILEAAVQLTEAEQELEQKKWQREIHRRHNVLEDILRRYESRTNGVNGMRGTAWAALNAVTEAADHGKLGGTYRNAESERSLSRRLESTVYGDADHIKQVAYAEAKALAV